MKKKWIMILVVIFSLIPFNHIQAANLENIVYVQLGQDSNSSVSLRMIDNGELIYEKNGDSLMKPASTLKLLTAAAAVDTLGPNYRFHTKLYIDGSIEHRVLHGDIYIKGEGDPTLQQKDFITFASVLKQFGIESVNGNLYGDDTFFIGDQLSPGIAKEDESYYFAARTSALTMSPDQDYDAGTLIVNAHATSLGRAPVISVEPNHSGMIILNQAVTVNQNQESTIEMNRQYGTNKILVTGNIPIDTSFKDWVTLYDPTINTLQAMKKTFEDFGITFNEDMLIERKAIPINANHLYTKQSSSLKKLLNPFLKLSNNSIADILIKTMGHELYNKGDLDAGIEALKTYGNVIGLNMNYWRFEDGSGLSHQNKVSANELTDLLYKLNNHSNFPFIFSNLPIGGQSDRFIGGSLRKRFQEPAYENRVFAKTGHISGVYTLAGYVKANSGQTYAFAIMTQNQTSIKLDAIDEVVKTVIQTY